MSDETDTEPAMLVYVITANELDAQWAIEELVDASFLEDEIVVLVRDRNDADAQVQALAVQGQSQAALGLCMGATVGLLLGIGLGQLFPEAVKWTSDTALVGACVGSVLGLVGGMFSYRHTIETAARQFTPRAFLVGVRTRGARTESARGALRATGAFPVLVRTPREAIGGFHHPTSPPAKVRTFRPGTGASRPST